MDVQSRAALDVLLEVAQVLGDPQAPREMVGLLTRVAEIMRRLEAVDFVHAMMIENKSRLVPICMVGVPPEVEAQWRADVSAATLARIPRHAEILARLRAGELFVQRLDREPPLISHAASVGNHAQAAITAPVVVEGQVRALLTISRARPPDPSSASGFAPWDEDLLADVTRLIGEALAHASRAEQLRAAETARTIAEETTRERDDFIGIAGHELRTPLTTISANAQLLERGIQQMRTLLSAEEPPDPAVLDTRLIRLSEHVQRISRRCVLLARLIDDLVEVSRIHAQRLDLAERHCDLATMLREVVAEQRHMNPKRGIRLSGLGPKAALPALADPDRIAQVLTNLLTNALKYSMPTTPIIVRVTHERDRVRVAVRDEGPGLSPEQQRRVWDRFYRAPGIEVQSGSGVGLGLGLFISREIVERHGGTIGVESAPGAGSTFWFTVPLIGGDGRSRGD